MSIRPIENQSRRPCVEGGMGKTHRTRSVHRRLVAGLALTALAATACSGEDDSSTDATTGTFDEATEFDDSGRAVDAADADTVSGGDALDETTAETTATDGDAAEAPAASTDATTGSTSSPILINDFGRDVIREVGITMQTPDVRRTADDVRRLTDANGGAVFRSDIGIGDVQDDGTVPGGGTIVIRIPPPDLPTLIEDLDGLGIVTRIDQDAEDVTDQLVDLEIRIRQARAGIASIEALLADAVELDDLFSIENELNRRQVDLERLLAAQRSTEDRVSLATLTVEIVHRPLDADPVVLEPQTDEGIADAFANGWNAFVGVLFAIGFVLAVSSPFLALAGGLALVVWLVGRRLRRNDRSARTDTATTGSGTRPGDDLPRPTEEDELVSAGRSDR